MNEKQDIDLRARITTEYDATGAEAAQKAVNDLTQSAVSSADAQSAAADGVNKALSEIDATPVIEGVDQSSAAVKNFESTTETAGKKQVEMTKAGVEGYKDLGNEVDDVSSKVDKMKAVRSEDVAKQEDSMSSVLQSHRNLRESIGTTQKKEKEQSNASIMNNSRLLSILTAMRGGWGALITRLISFTGVVGAMIAVIGIAKAAWDLMHKSANDAIAKQREADNKQRESLVKVTAKLTAERIAMQNAAGRSSREWNEQGKLDLYEEERLKIREINDELIQQAKLKAALIDDEFERKRIQREDDLYRGKITQLDYDRQAADDAREQKQSKRTVDIDVQKALYKKAKEEEDSKAEELSDAVRKLADLIQDPRFLSREDRYENESIIQNYKAKDVDVQIDELKRERARLQEEKNGTENHLQKTMIEAEIEVIREKLYPLLDQRDAHDKAVTKEVSFQDLMGENDLKGENPEELWKKAEELGKTVNVISNGLEALGKVTEKTLSEWEKVEIRQASQQKTDDLQYKVDIAKAEKEDQKRKAEENKTAIAALNEESGKLSSSLTNVTAKIKEFRAVQLQLLTDSGVKGDMATNVKKIGHKPELTEEDRDSLGNYRDTLSRRTDGNNTERRQMVAIIDNILKSFEMEAKETAKFNAQIEQRNKKAGSLTRENRGAEKRSKMQEVYAQAQEEVGKLPGNNDIIRREMDKTKSLADRAVADNVVQPGEFQALNAKLSEWLAVQRTQEGAALGAQMVTMLDQAISLATAQKAESAALKQKLSSVETKLNNLASQSSK